jgi:ankyrin repeat protein
MKEENNSLIGAIKKGDLEAVCDLLDTGINANSVNSALVIAAELGHLNIVEVLLVAEINLINQGYDALWAAANNGHIDIVKTLCLPTTSNNCCKNSDERWSSF